MKKPNQISNSTEALSENVHRHDKWLAKQNITAKKKLSPKMYDMFQRYNQEMVMTAHSNSSRHKNLIQFISIVNRFKIDDLATIAEEQIKKMVIEIMETHSNNGQETHYSQDLKKQLRYMIRFAKTGTRMKSEHGDLPELLCIKGKSIADKLTRKDLPTDEDCSKLLRACGDSIMDRAMLAVHMEAGTRIKEILSLQLKHIVLDEYGAIISVDGKTGARKVRIVSSVSYLIKWINVHPFKDDRNHALFISTYQTKYFGCGLSYGGWTMRLKKIVKRSGLDKKIHSHIFRHKEITDLAGKLTEAESRIRHGWGKTSNMPSRYTHMNNKDVDDKMLKIYGVKKKVEEEEPIFIECHFCHIKHPVDTRFCETCARPLDVVEAERLQRESKEENKAMVYELMREQKAKEAKNNHQNKLDKQLEKQMKAQEEEIQLLKDMITKMSKTE
jgi:integrase/recombinase XerD